MGVTLGDGTSPVSFRLADLRAMKVRSVSRRPGRGALIGLATGLAVSLIGAALVCEKQAGNKENYCGLGFVLGPPVFGAMGTIAGAVIGTFVHGESWKPVQFAPP